MSLGLIFNSKFIHLSIYEVWIPIVNFLTPMHFAFWIPMVNYLILMCFGFQLSCLITFGFCILMISYFILYLGLQLSFSNLTVFCATINSSLHAWPKYGNLCPTWLIYISFSLSPNMNIFVIKVIRILTTSNILTTYVMQINPFAYCTATKIFLLRIQ